MLLAERKAKKGSEGSTGKRYRSKRLEQASTTESDGQMAIVLNNAVELRIALIAGVIGM
ncbi:hypothetical protein PHMEG_00029245 [Phytophthora megakarya]|uniref:Uncharacterized protein n=1 Tax=Phytophthora megakarya TaxID=4795 RepID=A0A225V3Q6_9STRA|nr:hypothetical protein PHMEG_00029245 [Phytophthora megakarya]